ncbi:hypothetical protein HAX54_014869, partial [Datura stramonium]|nr:hypothetical protein [Datura stramonium]
PRTARSPLSFWGDGGIIPFEPFYSSLKIEMGAGLKKDVKVSRVGPEGSLNAFYFHIKVVSQRFPRVRYLVQVQDCPAAPGKRLEEESEYFVHAPLGLGRYSLV